MDILGDHVGVFYYDIYFPKAAQGILDWIATVDSETTSAVIACWAYEAECDLMRD